LNGKSSLEIAGGAVLIILGILFVLTLGISFLNLTTDAIFIIFGILLIRGAYRKGRLDSTQLSSQKERNRAAANGKAATKKKDKPTNTNAKG
jgi:hypothetical protein